MNSFDYYNPVKILFGKGKISELSNEIPLQARILMTYGGGSIKRNGVYEQVMQALKQHEIIEFSGIEPNPKFPTLMKAVEKVKKEKVDFLLAVGGGSVIDGTKFIAAASCFEGNDAWDILTKQAEIKKAIPLGTVLTLPATGSEMNSGSVVSKAETNEKLYFGSPLVFPVFSVLDPETTYSLPKKQIANGVIDAFVHVAEQYLTYPNNTPVQDRLAEGIFLTLIKEGKKAYDLKTPDYDNRANFMWAATMALNGHLSAGTLLDLSSHWIGHELTAFHGIDHGTTLAIILPGVLNHTKKERKEKLLQYAERVWGLVVGSDEDKIDIAIKKTEKFFNSLGVSTRLADYGVGRKTIERIHNRFKERGYEYVSMQTDIKLDDVPKILESRL